MGLATKVGLATVGLATMGLATKVGLEGQRRLRLVG